MSIEMDNNESEFWHFAQHGTRADWKLVICRDDLSSVVYACILKNLVMLVLVLPFATVIVTYTLTNIIVLHEMQISNIGTGYFKKFLDENRIHGIRSEFVREADVETMTISVWKLFMASKTKILTRSWALYTVHTYTNTTRCCKNSSIIFHSIKLIIVPIWVYCIF